MWKHYYLVRTIKTKIVITLYVNENMKVIIRQVRKSETGGSNTEPYTRNESKSKITSDGI